MREKDTSSSDPVLALFGDDLEELTCLKQGLANLATLPEFNPENNSPPPVPGKRFEPGVIGFRSGKKSPTLAVAGGTNMVRYISLEKYVALVEKLHDRNSATIMLQNFSDQDEQRSGRGQILGRINAKHSAITIVQGVTGRIVRGAEDIALFDVYYLDRKDLTAFYIAAKYQLSNADTLDSMIAAYDGWRAYDIPLDPLNPYDLGGFDPGMTIP